MKCIISIAVVITFLAVTAFASVGFSNCTESFVDGFQPTQPSEAQPLCKAGAIAISYDVTMIDPAWSAYLITYEEASNELSGRLDFYEDPDLQQLGIEQAAVNSDAFNTSWNRGHVAPNHILSYSEDTKKGTFSMANVAPQEAIFNQQSWNQLESDVLDWILTSKKSLHIVTGVAYKSRAHARRTFDNIAIPDYYWKVICDADGGHSAGFYGDNNVGGKANTFHTVKDVEALYGGSILPKDRCNTGSVTPSHWWTF